MCARIAPVFAVLARFKDKSCFECALAMLAYFLCLRVQRQELFLNVRSQVLRILILFLYVFRSSHIKHNSLVVEQLRENEYSGE